MIVGKYSTLSLVECWIWLSTIVVIFPWKLVCSEPKILLDNVIFLHLYVSTFTFFALRNLVTLGNTVKYRMSTLSQSFHQTSVTSNFQLAWYYFCENVMFQLLLCRSSELSYVWKFYEIITVICPCLRVRFRAGSEALAFHARKLSHLLLT